MKQVNNYNLLDYIVYTQYIDFLYSLGTSYVPKTFTRYIVIDIQNNK